ncbi:MULTISPECIES: helix-turn-helix transcriptional regulator [unclassified Erwinia]|uniref:helix-turn-helix domain-containing protein n=1 Tax=unclassified Erwinia TaxID=2622719 RepID=UPI00082F291A|nr:helix-turn-helix transcriptional regulator [Erwinia sp. ErVv1]
MRAYGNVLFSFYSENLFFKKGLYELLDEVHSLSNYSDSTKKILNYGISSDYYWIDIVVLSSKSIFEKLPQRETSLGDDSTGVIVFCSENMKHVVKGISGYENAIFFTDNLNLVEVKRVLSNIIFGGSNNRRGIFEKTKFDQLTDREKLVSVLLKKGMSHKEISKLTGINVKTVSSHLRSAMSKYKVNNVLEYWAKLLYINDVNCS